MKKQLNSFQLKCICISLMIIGVCLQQVVYILNRDVIAAEGQLSAVFTLIYNTGYLIYLAAFPVASFLLVEAVRKTSDRKCLFKRLLVAAMMVEIPMDIATFGISKWKSWGLNQNYFFTMCIALGMLMAVDAIGKMFKTGSMGHTLATLLVYLSGAFVAILARTELSSIGVLMIVIIYLFRANKMFSFFAVALLYLMLIQQFFPAFAVLLTWFYNGEQGKNDKVTRGIFYFAFPVVYVVLGIVAQLL